MLLKWLCLSGAKLARCKVNVKLHGWCKVVEKKYIWPALRMIAIPKQSTSKWFWSQ